jgi:hypothetical protein
MLCLCVASPSMAQGTWTNAKVINLAKSTDVHAIDPSLSSQRLEDWLQNGQPHANVRWDVSSTCDNRPDPHFDYPLCAKVWFNRDGEAGSFLIEVGTTHKGIQGQPKLYSGILSWEDSPGWIMTDGAEKLSDLPSVLDRPPYAHNVAVLYNHIAKHHLVGIPSDSQLAAIQPFLSRRLAAQIQTAKACEADFLRQHSANSNNNPKPSWLENGLFTGGGYRVSPASAWPVREGPQKDGSFLVLVNLFARNINLGGGLQGGAYSPSSNWHVHVRVIPEDRNFVIDDVRLFDGDSTDGPSHLLSESFSGCDGGHWIGQTATGR